MLVVNNDNAKIKLKNQQAFIINNNSKVYIADNNVTNIVITKENTNINDTIASITINKGNTVNNLVSSLLSSSYNNLANDILNYDIVYGNSSLTTKQTNWLRTKHEYLIDYNFPAARYNINGYKNAYSPLLNKGTEVYWTNINKGILIDNVSVKNLNKVPSRMNGYTATISNFNNDLISGKYNGILVINELNKILTADFVFNLQLNNSNNTNFSNYQIFNFSNITYLNINGGVGAATTILKNVRYSILNSEGKSILQNSNIVINKLNNISNQSYNAFISLNVNNSEYKNYILSGIKITNNELKDLHKNVFINTIKYQKQTLHPINTEGGYNSNLPVGAIIWYPEVWSSFNPLHDKNDTFNPRIVLSRGQPNTTDWALCDGTEVSNDCLYQQIYGQTKTPNYKVDQLFYKNPAIKRTGHHYLTQQSIVHFSPSTVISAFPLYAGVAAKLDDPLGDNKHKSNWIWVKQNLNGPYDLQMQVKGNWRCHGVTYVKFIVDVSQINQNFQTIKKNFSIQFDSYCCDGVDWWDGWTGGDIDSQGVRGHRNNDTINVPKLAIKLYDLDSANFKLECISGDSKKLFDTYSTELRAMYNSSHSIIKNMRLQQNPDGGSDYTPCTDCILTPKLPYTLKTYKLTLKTIPTSNKIEFILCFQLALPSTVGYWRCKNHYSNQYTQRWFTSRNRDKTQNGAPYHMFWQADFISMMSNLKIVYNGLEIGVIPAKKDGTEIKKCLMWSNEDWPTVKNTKSVSGTFIDYQYLNMGLFRRLNPYIKINDSGIKKEIPIQRDIKIDVIKNPVKLIKFRNNKSLTTTQIQALNVNKISNDELSACYCLDNWNILKNNVVDWEYKIEKNDLIDLYVFKETSEIKFVDNSAILSCNVYSKQNDNEYLYIELIDNHEIQQLFSSETVNLYDENNNIIGTEEKYINLNLQLNKFNVYHDLNYDIINTTEPTDIYYSYYNLKFNGNKYELSFNIDLIKFAANSKMLYNTIKAINNEVKNGYINTNPNSLPIFYYDDQTLIEQSKQYNNYFNVDNNPIAVESYYLLGTKNRVLSTTVAVSSYTYQLSYNETNKTAKVGNYTKTVATNNYNEENVPLFQVALSAEVLKNNSDLQTNVYKFTTTLTSNLDPNTVNLQIYNKINKYINALSASLISVKNNVNTINDLSITEYEYYLNTFVSNYTDITNISQVKPISGLSV